MPRLMRNSCGQFIDRGLGWTPLSLGAPITRVSSEASEVPTPRPQPVFQPTVVTLSPIQPVPTAPMQAVVPPRQNNVASGLTAGDCFFLGGKVVSTQIDTGTGKTCFAQVCEIGEGNAKEVRIIKDTLACVGD